MSTNHYAKLIVGVKIQKWDVWKSNGELTEAGKELEVYGSDPDDEISFGFRQDGFGCHESYDEGSEEYECYFGIDLAELQEDGSERVRRQDIDYYYNKLVKMLLKNEDLKVLVDNPIDVFLLKGTF